MKTGNSQKADIKGQAPSKGQTAHLPWWITDSTIPGKPILEKSPNFKSTRDTSQISWSYHMPWIMFMH
uniref:Uncharacterized protein n=1 Tax=Setaria viridis TaxID=4556 RepID=A0A4U6UJK8_SETVI|nr:hypothetical protein SEVIR_5G251400v2 [Setaria viridis]